MPVISHLAIRRAYSGFWPTSTNAAVGPLSDLKVSSSVGKAATTSGHQGRCVVGSLEARKAMKKGEFAGISNCESERGAAKFLRIGMLLDARDGFHAMRDGFF